MNVVTVFAKAVIAQFEGCRQRNVVTVFAEAVTTRGICPKAAVADRENCPSTGKLMAEDGKLRQIPTPEGEATGRFARSRRSAENGAISLEFSDLPSESHIRLCLCADK
jgi:hypothetical protein